MKKTTLVFGLVMGIIAMSIFLHGCGGDTCSNPPPSGPPQNFCVPPAGYDTDDWWNKVKGADSQSACAAAGGSWVPLTTALGRYENARRNHPDWPELKLVRRGHRSCLTW